MSKKFLIIVGLIVMIPVIFGLVNLVRNAYTGPLHCQSCHPVQTKLWQDSGPHSIETQCSDCHAPWPHVLPRSANVFRQYRDALLPTDLRARDELISANCMQCHEAVLDGSYVTSIIVVMSHRVHQEDDMLCIDCHRNISHDTKTGRTYRPPKAVCYECHLRDIDVSSPQDHSCMNCHRIILSRANSTQRMLNQ